MSSAMVSFALRFFFGYGIRAIVVRGPRRRAQAGVDPAWSPSP
jgi:hypothetical protein